LSCTAAADKAGDDTRLANTATTNVKVSKVTSCRVLDI